MSHNTARPPSPTAKKRTASRSPRRKRASNRARIEKTSEHELPVGTSNYSNSSSLAPSFSTPMSPSVPSSPSLPSLSPPSSSSPDNAVTTLFTDPGTMITNIIAQIQQASTVGQLGLLHQQNPDIYKAFKQALTDALHAVKSNDTNNENQTGNENQTNNENQTGGPGTMVGVNALDDYDHDHTIAEDEPPPPSPPTPQRTFTRRKFKTCPMCAVMPIAPPNGFCWAATSGQKTILLTVTETDISITRERLVKRQCYIQWIRQKMSSLGIDDNELDDIPSLGHCTNRQKRLIVYYKIFLSWWVDVEREDPSVWEILTPCIVQEVSERYPDDLDDKEIARQEKLVENGQEEGDDGPTMYNHNYNQNYDYCEHLEIECIHMNDD